MTADANPCPGCGKAVEFSDDNPWRPFCSKRCKLTDLGQWFAERYAIPDEAEQAADLPPPKRPQ